MKLTFIGAAGTVTGSGFILTSDSGRSILVDLGMYQGTKEEEKLNYVPLSFDPSTLIGVVLTHAHLDHCGRLPILMRGGYHGRLYMTRATASLTQLTLSDAAHVMTLHEENPPLYNIHDVEKLLGRVMAVNYDEEFTIGPFRLTMKDAGHILGSASVVIRDTSAYGAIKSIVFSGDLGNSPEDIVRPTEPVGAVDAVVMESTYGDKLHPKEDTMALIQREFNSVEESGGTLLIPAFSLDRTQELLHKIDHLKKEGRIRNETPVFLDSPMAISATEIYESYRELYSKELTEHSKVDDPFNFPALSMVQESRESRKIKEVEGAKVIIAGNGMMAGGRILKHSVEYLPIPTTRLLMVGYQGVQTLGRQIAEGARDVVIDGHPVHINATVSESIGMSAHADQAGLLSWLGAIKGVKKVFLAHGENPAREAFSQKVKSDLNIQDVFIPSIQQSFDL